MKHRIIIFAVLLLAGGCLSAQNTESTAIPDNNGSTTASFSKWSVGATVGVDINVPIVGVAYMTDVEYGPRLGFGYGLNVAYRPFKWLAIRSGLNLLDKDYAFTHTISLGENQATLVNLTSCKYLDLPVMADFSVGKKVRWHLLFGGYIGYWLSGSRMGNTIPLMIVNDPGLVTEDYPFNSVRDNRFDAGLIYGPAMSIACSRVVDINIELLFFHGLTDVQKNYMMQLNPHYNTTTLLQAGVTFNL